MTVRIYKPEARPALAAKLMANDFVITDAGKLYRVAFADKRRAGAYHHYVVTAHAEYQDGVWWKTPPGTQIHPLFATADNETEAVDFAEQVVDYFRTKEEEISRLENQFLVAVRMLADEIV